MPRVSEASRRIVAPSSFLLRHIPVLRLALFEFLSSADLCCLLATCRQLRNDIENVELLLLLSPVTSVVFHSHSIPRLGCLPSATPSPSLYEVSCASAFSVAALWEKDLLPMCYQWHHGHRISLRLEPFVLPLHDTVHATADIHSALDGVLKGLGQAYLDASAAEQLEWVVSDPEKPCQDVDTEDEDDGLHVLTNSDSDDSDWDDSDSESDLDGDDSDDVDWLHSVASPTRESRLHAKVYRPLLRLFKTNRFECTRWTSVPLETTKRDHTWRSHLLVGLSPTHTVLGGALVKAKAY